jgi:hypothetical protein
MGSPNKGTAVYRRAKAKGYAMYDNPGTKEDENLSRSNQWAAKSRMFHDEREGREVRKGAKSNVNKVDKRRRSGDMSAPPKRAKNVKVGAIK